MQKRVIKIIIGYILLMCLVGAGLLIKRKIDNIPVINDELIQELIENTEAPAIGASEVPSPSSDIENNHQELEGKEGNYWENYNRETKIGQGEKNPVLSQINKKITTGDKLRIMKIIRQNLSSDEIKYILSLSKDGFTRDEQIEIKSILQEKIGAEDKEELKDIILKYFVE